MGAKRAAVVVMFGLVLTALAAASSGSFPPPGKVVYTVATPSPGVAPYTLFTARTDGTGVTQLTSPGPRRDFEARWSPDGQRVAFTRVEPDGVYSTIWVVNADGSEAHLVGEGGYAEHAQWSPDGRWIAYQVQGAFGTGGGRDDTTYDLWIVRPDGSGDRALDAGAAYGSSEPFIGYGNGWAWSPDSKQIAFVYNDEPVESDLGGHVVAVLNIATGNKRMRTTGSYPVWSPDGKSLVVTDRCRLWLMPVKGGKRTPLTPRTKNNYECQSDLAWSPDGRSIAWTEGDANALWFSVVTPEGRHESRVRPISAAAVRWPRDCQRLFFYQSRYVGRVGWIVHGARGAPRFARPPARTYADWHC